MNWIELAIQTDAEGAEAAAALLSEYVTGGAAIEETILPEPGETLDPARTFTVRAFFPATDRANLEQAETSLWHLAQLREMSAPRTRELAEEDWAEAWKKYYTILHVGQHLVIKPSWLEYAPQSDDIVVELDPGMAFGTGLHPTTRLCMRALENYSPNLAKVSEPSQGYKMIDVGTGSGILSITAAKLGAREILALDTDAVAVETARRNIAFNHTEPIVRIEQGSLDAEKQRDQFDVVCINILAEVICELAPAIASALKSPGIVIASGILDYKADTVVEALNAVGIDIIEKKQEDDWVALVGRKP
jgi:ribosomal protein L11 methyltransferase